MTEEVIIGQGDRMLARLESSARGGGAAVVADRLVAMRAFLGDDLRQVEEELGVLEGKATPLHRSARHLLDLGGKRLRPICVALASRVGRGFVPAAREIAVAVELIHSATLLHDDVVDVGDLRRGAPTARVLYGNAASIFAGDWLLVDALQRIQRVGIPGLLDRVLGVLKEMLDAEALQLENRGKLRVPQADYFRVIEGKTASLFRWGMFAGGRAGEASPGQCEALACFGQSLGVAFQVIDDVLDVAGDEATVGKTMFADLREGKVTFPLLVALDRDAGLEEMLREVLGGEETGGEVDIALRIRASGAVEESLALAARLSSEALGHLVALPPGPVRDALEGVALAMLHRVH
ncbi:MAG: polyprenyl synthetase family protein [Myxococcales bacterium]|nr:polyprenyl synthetase family protein [Polyangiaceae bacterium]MDW8247718.1 polyprenyl synthetase family protein [Myxococcales bacterium]